MPETNIITAEDPVEFQMAGVNQVQMKDAIGLNFAAALRSFLRQDPNIILVGEIRDFETAEIAIKAALTGHLVLSTLHTNDAPSTISRLMNMGIEPFLVATSVNVIAAQRLVRRICQNCKEEIETPDPGAALDRVLRRARRTASSWSRGAGARSAATPGTRGAIGLFEVMDMTEDMRELVLSGATAVELRRKAIEEGMVTLAAVGAAEDPRGRHHHRRGGAGDDPVEGANMAITLHELLKTMVEKGATDLHVTTNTPPVIRIDGALERLPLPNLTAPETKRLAYSVLTDAQKHRLEETLELDLSFGIKGLARFRANIFFQRGAVGGAFRRIPYEILGFKELGLPPHRRGAVREAARPGAGDRARPGAASRRRSRR